MTSEDEFLSCVDVSRETMERFRGYSRLLERWNTKINLVAPSTLPALWSRHFLDSVQLWDLAPDPLTTWMDLGSGGGFPALVLAILAKERSPKVVFQLVESDQRKAAFLRTVVREIDLNADVTADRIESVKKCSPSVISARALAPLSKLLEYAYRQQDEHTVCLFPKGKAAQHEVEEARKTWDFSMMEFASKTDPQATILKIEEIQRA